MTTRGGTSPGGAEMTPIRERSLPDFRKYDIKEVLDALGPINVSSPALRGGPDITRTVTSIHTTSAAAREQIKERTHVS